MFGDRIKVVVIGAGFAGLNCALELSKDQAIDITVIDKANHHLFQPLLYQVATAGLSPADISSPIRAVLSEKNNVSVILAHVDTIEPDKKQVVLDDGNQVSYDYLVVATGARHAYFGNDEWEKLAPGLKTLEDAVEIRRRILLAFEDAEKISQVSERTALLTFAIVGAGPTGVEMAGAIAELARFALRKDFRNIKPESVHVVLIEASNRILRDFSNKLSSAAFRHLKKLGVTTELNQAVTKITEEGVWLGERFIPSKTVVWAAGVFASRLGKQLGAEVESNGRVIVEPDLSIKNHPEIFVAGDLSLVKDKNGVVPAMAPGAIQEGIHSARNIILKLRGKPTQAFKFFNKGSLATVGRSFAVAQMGRLSFSGLFAHLIWVFVHIMYLVSFRNRLLVLLQWMWYYFTFQRGARLITGETVRPHGSEIKS